MKDHETQEKAQTVKSELFNTLGKELSETSKWLPEGTGITVLLGVNPEKRTKQIQPSMRIVEYYVIDTVEYGLIELNMAQITRISRLARALPANATVLTTVV